ncbi:polyisoprenoid-binding protein [Sphingomonas gei]|uniref:Polyisoprenoid-binding protein n=1 Tax=Sphingomonas gei TaxID=1395960 RepID=A0A4S1XBF5_9SPHN|nr:YceI family protein [Sphingomonas gei]TGX52156.1 polyisoprenoid-binding protein [Sphingomonas gei]
MRIRTIALAATLLVATPLVAQQAMQVPGSKNPALVTAGSYTADPGHTLIEWQVDHLGFTPYFGLFGEISGNLTLDPKNPSAAKVDITIPVSKVVTASAGLTGHLLRAPKEAASKPDFFGPTPADARFVSTKVVASGQTAKVTGNLTLNGVTKPVTLDVSFYGAGKSPAQMGGKDNLGFEALATIKRTEFGIGFGVPMVSDEVKLKIAAAFTKD